jgi:hypothetical protein
MSSYGWTYPSRDALRRAENQLSGAGEGMRDEIGFLIIHQRYADHFFPGTSVLHTRMRYALFVPWIYQTLYEEGAPGRVQDGQARRAAEAFAWRDRRRQFSTTDEPASLVELLGRSRRVGSPARDGWAAALSRAKFMLFFNRSTAKLRMMTDKPFCARSFPSPLCRHDRMTGLALGL